MACNPPAVEVPDVATHGITLPYARQQLAVWLGALQALAGGVRRYKIADRELERTDLGEVRRMIEFWQAQEKGLAAGAAGGQIGRVKSLRRGCC